MPASISPPHRSPLLTRALAVACLAVLASGCGDILIPQDGEVSGSDANADISGNEVGQAVPCEFGQDEQCDDGDSCTVDECAATGVCVYNPATSVCRIEDVCYAVGEGASVDACQVCDDEVSKTEWTPLVCDDGNSCTVDSCDTATGCVFAPRDSGACDDGNPASQGDYCSSGVCTGSGGEPCGAASECDDGISCTVGDCVGSVCVYTVDVGTCAVEGACLEGFATSTTSVCLVCDADADGWAWSAPDCDDDNPCTDDSCLDNVGCIHADNDANVCDDGEECSSDDHCLAGNCVASSCGCIDSDECDDGRACTTDTCDEGQCINVLVAGACLVDGACMISGEVAATDACLECAPGVSSSALTPVVCGDGNPCTDETCLAATGCEAANNDGNACSDGNTCTNDDHCEAGVCVATPCGCSTAVECDDGLACTADDCGPTGTCTNLLGPATCAIDGACHDGGSISAANECQTCDPANNPFAWSPVPCQDDEPCTNNGCAPGLGCVFVNDDSLPCDDGEECTADDHCSNGACTATPCGCADSADCDDGNACTTGVCVATVCEYTVNADSCLIEATCYDSGALAAGDACGGCDPLADPTAWTPIGCDDGNPCTADACDSTDGCVYTNNDALTCDDGISCTTDDHCDGGQCVATPCGCQSNAECDDGRACTTDICDTGGDCDNVLSAGSCLIGGTCYSSGQTSGSNACLQCDPAGDTIDWTTVTCADGVECTDDNCNPATGCQYTPDDTNTCSDGDSCTTSDACSVGTCSGIWDEPSCGCISDGFCSSLSDTCNIGRCDMTDNSCYAEPQMGASCSDGIACTSDDVCTASGSCAGTSYTCSGSSCETATCDGQGGCNTTIDTGWCLIAGSCIANGTPNGSNSCQQCSSTADSGDWTDESDGTSCDADGNGCTVSDSCASGTCQAGATESCNDGKACTTDTCTSLGATGFQCSNPVNTSSCLISGTCYSSGTDNPSNECEECTGGTVSWSGKPPSTTCGSAPGECKTWATCGTAASCGSQGNASSGTDCGSNSNTACTNPDTCDGNGSCASNHASTSTPCSDGSQCTVGDTCSGTGVCTPGNVNCNDGNGCTVDSCVGTLCQHNDAPPGQTCAPPFGFCAGICSGSVCQGFQPPPCP